MQLFWIIRERSPYQEKNLWEKRLMGWFPCSGQSHSKLSSKKKRKIKDPLHPIQPSPGISLFVAYVWYVQLKFFSLFRRWYFRCRPLISDSSWTRFSIGLYQKEVSDCWVCPAVRWGVFYGFSSSSFHFLLEYLLSNICWLFLHPVGLLGGGACLRVFFCTYTSFNWTESIYVQ